jgi:hypothetical protein
MCEEECVLDKTTTLQQSSYGKIIPWLFVPWNYKLIYGVIIWFW